MISRVCPCWRSAALSTDATYVYFLTHGWRMHALSIIYRSAVTGWVPSRKAYLMIAFLLAVRDELMIKTVRMGANQGSSHQAHFACGIEYGFLPLEGIPKVRQVMLSSAARLKCSRYVERLLHAYLLGLSVRYFPATMTWLHTLRPNS